MVDGLIVEQFRFWAFISYSHRDTLQVKRLHRRLEHYRVPRRFVGQIHSSGRIPRRLFPIYRDRDESSGGPDIDREIQLRLEQSRFLLVACSPHSAASLYVNNEIMYFKSLGRGQHIIYLNIQGEPVITAGGSLPKAARFRFDSRARPVDDGPLPTCIDARRGKDGPANAFFKVVSQLLEIGFDDLKRRDVRRRRHRTILATAGTTVLAGILLIAYIAVADQGAMLPGGAYLRTGLDRSGLSVFRPVPTLPWCQSTASAKREQVSKVLLREFQTGKWSRGGTGKSVKLDVWTSAQAATAIMKCTQISNPDARTCLRVLDRAFLPSELTERKGRHYGWTPVHDDFTQAEPALWMVAASATALGRPGLLTGDERTIWMKHFSYAQSVADEYCRDDGAWNAVTGVRPPTTPCTYTTILALLALLETKTNQLPWDQSQTRRDEMIGATVGWLIRNFHGEVNPPGWFASSNTNRAAAIDGLTLQAFALLVRAQNETQLTLPSTLQHAVRTYLLSLYGRDSRYPSVTIRPSFDYIDLDGRPRSIETPVRCLWRPWATVLACDWLNSMKNTPVPPEDIACARRVLGTLVDDAPGSPYKPESQPLYASAEDLYRYAHVESDCR